MPQMMPLNWMFMFLFINLLLILFSMIIFNSFTPSTPSMTKTNLSSMKYNWSW